MKKYFKFIVAALVILIFIGTFVFLYVKSMPQEVVYEELTPQKMDINRTTILTGKIESRNEVNIKPQISGIITELYKEAGDVVQAGDIIAKVKVIPDMGQLSSAQSRVRLADVNLAQAEIDFQREKKLFEKKLVSADEYEKIRQTYQQAKEEKSAAIDALQVVRDGVSSNNANESSTLVRSTISGIILDIPVKVGNSVILSNNFNDGTTIATVADMGNLIFRGNVDETEVGLLSVGMSMKISIGALENLNFNAQLEYISPKAVENNGANQFEIKAAVNVPAGNKVRSGYSATAEITLKSAKNVIAIPESAVEFSNGKAFVYVVKKSDKEKEYEKREVTIGISDGINIEIKKGLTLNEKVRGSQKLGLNRESQDNDSKHSI
ncbi:MAG: efflux RND transporter periplasmic adaptor subunit [Paraprevotella sp.]|nr:efflux RND transporter periplasmic adaptor subunit [Paraprevotella sp.]